MKFSISKKILAVIACSLAAIACLSFAACGDSMGNGKEEGKTDNPPVTDTTSEAPLGEWKKSTWTYKNTEGADTTLDYLLFVPNAYDGKTDVPLVTWIGDASTVGNTQDKLLKQKAPAVWTSNEKVQKKTYLFLTFLFQNSSTSPETEGSAGSQIIPIIDKVCENYKVDENKLYLTGQSMGGICDFMLNTLHPDKFAATVYVACQPGGEGGPDDVQAQKVLTEAKFVNQKFVYIVSEKDEKAHPGQEAVQAVLTENDKQFTKLEGLAMNGDAVETAIKAELDKGLAHNFFAYTSTSKLDQSSGGQHMATWPLAYQVNAIWEWLFNQSL